MSDQSTDGPLDPFVQDRARHPEDIRDEAASERIHELLRGYEDADLLGGWIVFHEWIDEEDNHRIGVNVSPGLDWLRTLGLIDAGRLIERRAYLTADADGDEDDEDE